MFSRNQPPTTAEIQATVAFFFNEPLAQRCVDWAAYRLADGDDSRALRILAALSKPFDPFEVAPLRDQVLRERGLLLDATEAVQPYARELASRLLIPDADLEEPLQTLSDLCIEQGHEPKLFDFYLLECASRDLEHGPNCYHWPGATRENFRSICIEVATKWMDNNP